MEADCSGMCRRDWSILELLFTGKDNINFPEGWLVGCQGCHPFLLITDSPVTITSDGALPALAYTLEDITGKQKKKRGKHSCKKDIISSCQDWLHIWCLNNRATMHCLYHRGRSSRFILLQRVTWEYCGERNSSDPWHYFYLRVNARAKIFPLLTFFSNGNRHRRTQINWKVEVFILQK